MIFNLSFERNIKSLFYQQPRDEVRDFFASSFIEFKKSQFSENTADNFYKLMINCFYDENDLLQEIEIFKPNIVRILGVYNFIGKYDVDIKSRLSELDIVYESDDIGVVIESLGISTVSNHLGKVECVYCDLEKGSFLSISS